MTVTLRAGGEVLEIVVADTGVGIAAADLERLGRPYEQAGDADQQASGHGPGPVAGARLRRAARRRDDHRERAGRGHDGDRAPAGADRADRRRAEPTVGTAAASDRLQRLSAERAAGRRGRRRSRRPRHRRCAPSSPSPGNRNSTATASRGSSRRQRRAAARLGSGRPSRRSAPVRQQRRVGVGCGPRRHKAFGAPCAAAGARRAAGGRSSRR